MFVDEESEALVEFSGDSIVKMVVLLSKGSGVGIVLSEPVCSLLSSGIGFNADPVLSSLLSIISIYTLLP